MFSLSNWLLTPAASRRPVNYSNGTEVASHRHSDETNHAVCCQSILFSFTSLQRGVTDEITTAVQPFNGFGNH